MSAELARSPVADSQFSSAVWNSRAVAKRSSRRGAIARATSASSSGGMEGLRSMP